MDLRSAEIDAAASRLLPRRFCRRFAVLAFGFDDGVLVVGVAHPSNDVAIEAARGMLRRDIRLVVVTRSELFDAIERLEEHTRAVAAVATLPAPVGTDTARGARPHRARPVRRTLAGVAAVVACASAGLAGLVVTTGRSETNAVQSAGPEALRRDSEPPRVPKREAFAETVAGAATPGRTFAWVPVAAASSYAFELEVNSRPIYRVVTPDPRFTLPSAWTYRGKRYRLEPGLHRWRVWALDDVGDKRELVVNASLVV